MKIANMKIEVEPGEIDLSYVRVEHKTSTLIKMIIDSPQKYLTVESFSEHYDFESNPSTRLTFGRTLRSVRLGFDSWD
jgi:hypothetical protein